MENFRAGFVHPFATDSCYYLYDVNTTNIARVNKNIYNYFNTKSDTLETDDIKILAKMKERGLLKANNIKTIEHPLSEKLDEILKSKVESVTLQITQQCNLRCKYCPYSGNYNMRSHSSKTMKLDMVTRCIDYLVLHSRDLNTVNVGFYGGEPLLSYKIIRDAVKYATEKYPNKSFTYNITTNGTIFNDEILAFLESNNFSVLISLDGPKENHDANRIFASTGKGSFDVIMQNISYIKEKYNKLYKTLTFNAVLDPALDATCASKFFIQCEALEGTQITASIVSNDYRKNTITIGKEFYIHDDEEHFRYMMYKLGRIDRSKISKIAEGKFNQMLFQLSIFKIKTISIGESTHPSGPCVPGTRKLFINADGIFFPCESVSETEGMSIGTIEDGFNVEKVKLLLNVGKLTAEKCKRCWGIRLCPQCCMMADDLNGISASKRAQQCESVLGSNENMLKDYCTLVECGYKLENV